MEAIFVANRHARRRGAAVARVLGLLRSAGVDVVASYAAPDGDGVAALVAGAIRGGASNVIVAGGDGTMTKVVRAFARERATLGVIPLGTGNSFARSLGIAADLSAAVDTIARGRIARVGLGLVNGTHFANFATIGLASRIARNTSESLKSVAGPLAYALCGIGPFLRSEPFTCRIAWDDQQAEIRTHEIIIASGRCFGAQPLLAGKTIVDGRLALYASTGVTRAAVARSYAALYRGGHTLLADAFYFRARTIEIRTDSKQKLNVDGAACGKTPAAYSVDAGALNVFVPATFTGA